MAHEQYLETGEQRYLDIVVEDAEVDPEALEALVWLCENVVDEDYDGMRLRTGRSEADSRALGALRSLLVRNPGLRRRVRAIANGYKDSGDVQEVTMLLNRLDRG